MRRRANRRDYLSLLTLFGANNILLGSDCGRDSERQPKATHPNPLTTNSQRELVRIGNQSGLVWGRGEVRNHRYALDPSPSAVRSSCIGAITQPIGQRQF
jgi:hypothetical protein